MTQSQLELRRSVWDLRSRELQEFDFPQALRASAQQAADNAKLKLEVEIKGRVRPIPEVAEDNLLRISQEAMTNVMKHAQATRVDVLLEFREHDILLRISDDGRGFDPKNCPGSDQGHFGLPCMAERAKRLGGEWEITSSPGHGARVEARIPVGVANGNGSGAGANQKASV